MQRILSRADPFLFPNFPTELTDTVRDVFTGNEAICEPVDVWKVFRRNTLAPLARKILRNGGGSHIQHPRDLAN